MKAGKQTIIVVEDSAPVREALVNTLEERIGATSSVKSFADGAEFLAFLQEEPITEAVVVSDVVMPRLGGFELYDALRDERPGLKFLFVTGYPVDREEAYFLKREDVDILVKPFPPADLVAIVRRLSNGAGTNRRWK